jgi:cation:H+ antiporter
MPWWREPAPICFGPVVQTREAVLRPSFLLAVAAPLPGLAARLDLIHVPLVVETTLFGAAILGAAFLLSWAAEVAQLDISQTLAIAVLALIAVLPEYAVDLFLAYRAGQGDEAKRHLAVANMTGANRLLIGVGWAAVVLIPTSGSSWWPRCGRSPSPSEASSR